MASLLELQSLFIDSDLQDKAEAALIIGAWGLIDAASPTVAEQNWAAEAFANTTAQAKLAVKAVLAANNAATVAQIQAADDATIQTNVDDVIPALVIAFQNEP